MKAIRINKKILEEIAIIAIISCIIWLFFFLKLGKVPHDLRDEPTSYAMLVASYLDAAEKGIPIEEQKDNLNREFPFVPEDIEANIYNPPLINIYQMIIFKIFGVSKFTLNLGSSFIAVITIIFTYLLGRKMFNKWIGLIASVLLASSLFYVTHVRACWFWHSFPPLVSIFTFYLFYLAHNTGKKIYLWLSGIALGIAVFSGYSPVFAIPLIVCLFLVWSFLKKRNRKISEGDRLFNIKDYLFVFLIALVSLFGLDLLYSFVINGIPFKSMYWIVTTWIIRRGIYNTSALHNSIGLISTIKTIFSNLIILLKNFFIGMQEPEFSCFHILMVKYKPMLSLFPAIFLFIAIVKSIKGKNQIDRLLVIWFGVIIIVFGIVTSFSSRCLVSAAPVIYLLSAKGIADLLDIMAKRSYLSNKLIKNVSITTIVIIILLTIFSGYKNYYMIYGKKYRANIGTYYGEDAAAQYIKANAIKNSTYILHSSAPGVISCCDASYVSWIPFMFGLFEKMTLVNKNYTKPWGEEIWLYPELDEYNSFKKLRIYIPDSSKLRSLEEEILTKYKKIYFVLPYDYFSEGMPGVRSYLINTNKIILKKLHPFILPEMVVKDDYGVPAMEIYSIDKNTPAYYSHYWFATNNSFFKLWSPKDEYIDCMEIRGPANDVTITNETTGQKMNYPLNLFPNETITITYDKNSRIVFKPHIELFDFRNYAYKNENVEYNEKDHRYIQNSSSNGYIIYKIESPDIIRELIIEGRPCLFNNILWRNKIIYSYSIDGNIYKEIRRITSKGNLKWDGALANDTYDTIYPYSKDVFVRFDLKGNKGQMQLWSPCAYTAMGGTMNFVAYTDTSKWKNKRLLIKKGWNILKYTNKLAEPSQIILFPNAKMNSSWTIKGEYLYKDTDYTAGKRYYWYFEPGDLESGEYTFNFKIKASKIKTKEDICIIRIGSFSKPFKELKLSGKDIVYSDFKIDFECKNTDLVTLEILFMKQANIRLDSIKIEKKK